MRRNPPTSDQGNESDGTAKLKQLTQLLDSYDERLDGNSSASNQRGSGHGLQRQSRQEVENTGIRRFKPDLSFDQSFLDAAEENQQPQGWTPRPPPVSPSASPNNNRGYNKGESIARHYAKAGSNEYSGERPNDRKKRRARVVSSREDDEEGYRLDDDEFAAKRAARREKAKRKKRQRPIQIYLPEFINVSNLATVLKLRVEDFMKKVEDLGFGRLSNDHVMDAETAGLIAAEFNYEAIADSNEEKDIKPQPLLDDRTSLPPRPPIVTIMGHVDHGKTTMLDFLRKSSVAASEHGGITQHIGAFSVPMSGGRLVTFLDTPGHEAFLSMRQRGAVVTDIIVLVVAADDSVKPQTIEAIKHAQSAQVPVIVAVNKIDKGEADVDQVKKDLARHNVDIEDYGGDTQVVCVSGKTGAGMDQFEDAIVALADILDTRAEPDGAVEGWVLEAATSKAEGRIATVLIRRGTLRVGDVIVAGTSWARVRSLKNEAGVAVDSAGPGTPVEMDGWREQPIAGDEVLQAPDEQRARQVAQYRLETSQQQQLAKDVTAVNENRRLEQEKRRIIKQAREEAKARGEDPDEVDPEKVLPTNTTDMTTEKIFLIVKADVSGSVEAVTDAISALGNNEIQPHILRTGIGSVSEFDVDHAAVAQGHIVSFNTSCETGIQHLAETRGVRVLEHSIIYRLVDDVKSVLSARLPPTVTQRVLGEAEIAKIFDINIKGRQTRPFAGCRVRNGEISRKMKVRVLRDKEVIYNGMWILRSRLFEGFTIRT